MPVKARRDLDIKPRLTIELAELAHNSRVVVKPGKDDWFGETDISRFIQRVQIDAKVGDATKAKLDCILVNVETDGTVLEALLLRELSFSRFTRFRRWWWRLGFGFRTKLHEVTPIKAKERIYA